MTTQDLKIREDVKLIEQDIIDIRRKIHENPELGFQEFETSKLIAQKLTEFGYEVTTNVGKTGVVGILKGENPGKCYLFRADMDGLPITENSGDPHTSKVSGKHHACGHDGHVSMLLGFAKIAATMKHKIHGTIKVCFQPAEEGLAGAKSMLEDPNFKLLENPEVEMCFAAHLVPYAPVGEIWSVEGSVTANSDRIYIDIEGAGGHSSTPQDCKDSVLIGCQLVQSIYTIISRNTNPQESATITIGSIHSGTAANAISSKCRIEGTARSMNANTRDIIETRIQQLCNGFAEAFGCKITLNYQKLYNMTINTPEALQMVKSTAQKIIGKDNFKNRDFGLAGEDFSFFTAVKPCCYFMIGCAMEGSLTEKGTDRPLHSPFFTINEKALTIGTSVWVQFIEDHMFS